MFANLAKLPPGIEPKPAFTQFAGGLDLDTPPRLAKAGALRDAINYECGPEGGYQDIVGYERFDGRPKPSDAIFLTIDVTVTGTVNVGDAVVGASTASTGVVIAKTTHSGTSQTYLILTKVTGSWNNASENVTVSAVVQANTDSIGSFTAADSDLLVAQYKNLAADKYRADIAVVPGQNSVWGGFTLNGVKYAVRDKTGGATAAIYVQHATTGWTEVALGRQVDFVSGGTYVIAEGDTITGATSAATAVVRRIQLISGSFGAGTAVGWLTLSGQVGTFQAENLNVGANINVATIGGNSSALTLSPRNGTHKLDYFVSNFADGTNNRVYGATGSGLGFEFDGTYFAYIRTGMAADQPEHVIVHKNHLFFSFGASSQHSGIGDPFSWTVVTGAAEILASARVTGFQIQPGDAGNAALTIATREQMFTLYGNDSSDWNFIAYRENIGAYEWSIQTLAQMIFFDDLGLLDLASSQAFGSFEQSTLSRKIQTYIKDFAPTITVGACSCVVRNKNQYRLFTNALTGLYVTMNGTKVAGITKVLLGHAPVCMWSGEDTSGNEEIFFGDSTGYVFQMEKGTSFDGGNIAAYLETHVDHAGSLEVWKEYFGPATIEGRGANTDGTGYAALTVTYVLDYNRTTIEQAVSQSVELSPKTIATGEPAVFDLRGEGRNVRWRIEKDSDYMSPLLLSGVHYRHLPTTPMRG